MYLYVYIGIYRYTYSTYKGPALVLKMHTLVVMLLQCLSCCGKTWSGGGAITSCPPMS